MTLCDYHRCAHCCANSPPSYVFSKLGRGMRNKFIELLTAPARTYMTKVHIILT